ncbi:hypothetical protein [Peptoniphilus porci]
MEGISAGYKINRDLIAKNLDRRRPAKINSQLQDVNLMTFKL